MKKSEAVVLVRNVFHCLQKSRSNMDEYLDAQDHSDAVTEKIKMDLFPKLWDEKYFLAIQRMADKGEAVEPIDIYNLCFYCHHMEPVIVAVAKFLNVVIPEPQISMLYFDPEAE